MDADLILPVDAARLLPHRPPLSFIDQLVAYDAEGQGGTARVTLAAGHPLAGEDGELDPVVLVELLAQSYAAVRGYRDRLLGNPPRQGLLVAVRSLTIGGRPLIGDTLEIAVTTVGIYENFVLAEGTVRRDGETLASGSLRLFLMDEAAPDPEAP